MRPIKFRGKEKGGYSDGKFIHGYFAEKFNDDGELVPIIIWDTENPTYFSEVYPESVAQLVGYDADDNEVYDDDILIDEDGVEWEINQIPQIEMTIGGVPDYLYNPKYKFRLKK